MRSVLVGDPHAREEFATRMDFVGRLLGTLNRRHGQHLSDDELRDLAQETLLVVWRKLSEFQGRSTLETWIYRFTSLELQAALRKRAHRPRPLDGLAEEQAARISSAGGVDPALGAVEAADEPPPLRRFLGYLAEREAEVVRLRHLETLSFREIASALGISPSSAKTHYYRGLEKLRSLLLAPTAKEEDR